MNHLILGESTKELYRAKNILFFYGNKFHLLSSWFADFQSDHDLILELLEKNIHKHRVKEISYIYEVSKSNRLENDLRNHENDFYAATKKSVYETNYIYYDNASRMYAIQTLKPYSEAIIKATDLYEEIKECKQFLLKHKLEHLVKQADDLFRANVVNDLFEKQYFKAIDEIIKYINQQS